MIYQFYWEGGDGLEEMYMKIGSSTVGADEPEVIKKLMEDYIKIDLDGYNLPDFAKFLKEKGYQVEIIDKLYDYAIEF